MNEGQQSKKTNIVTLVGLAVVLALIAGLLLSLSHIAKTQKMYSIETFTECKEAGYSIIETFPEQCSTPDGRTFVNDTQSAPTVPSTSRTLFDSATTVPQAI